MRSRRGITMMEVAIGVLLVGGVLAATLQVVGPTVRSSRLAGDQTLASQFAHELLTEIALQPYQDADAHTTAIGPETGETGADRSRFDDVDDYHGWKDAITSATGVPRAGLQGNWERTVAVRWVSMTAPSGSVSLTDTGVKRITVEVRRNGILLAAESVLRTSGFDESRQQ